MGSPALFAVVAVLIFSASQRAAHCQDFAMDLRQISISISTERIQGVGFCRLTINNRPSVFLNLPLSSNFPIGTGTDVTFDSGANQVSVAGRPMPLRGETYQSVTQPGPLRFEEYTTMNAMNTAVRNGRVYTDGVTVVFSDSNLFNGLTGQNINRCPPPPPQCNVTTVRLNNELVLRVSCFPDNSAEGNIMELTGSQGFNVQANENLQYRSNTLQYRRGSITQNVFENIMDFYVMEDVSSGGQTGRQLRRFTGNAPGQVFTGPGTLRVGNFQGQMVALYSTSQSANMQIGMAIVDEQLTFDAIPDENIVRVSDVFTNNVLGGTPPGLPVPLVDLGGTAPTPYRVRNFPTARSISYNNGAITVSDGGGRVLASLRGYSSLNTFINSVNERPQPDAMGIDMLTASVPEGGLTLYTNQNSMGQNQAFGVAGIDGPQIQTRINNALRQITVPSNPSTRFSIQGFNDGSAVFSANGEEVVTLTDRAPIAVGSGQIVNFDGMNVEIYQPNDLSTPISGSPFTVSNFTVYETISGRPGRYFNLYDSSNMPSEDFTGPGLLYVDDDGRGFYTNDQPTQQFIDGFVQGLPPSPIDVVARTVNMMRVVNLENNGRRLVEVSSSSTTPVGGTQGVIYLNSMVRTANGFTVPSASRVVSRQSTTNPSQRVIEVVAPNGQTQFSTTTTNFRSRQGNAPSQPVMPINTTLPGGGVIYFEPNGGTVVYNSDTTVSMPLVMDLMNNGIMVPTNAMNINELNFYNGRRVIPYSGMAPTFLQGPGTVYTSGNQGFYSTDVVRNSQIASEVSRLLPTSFITNSTTGTIRINTGTGMSLFNFTSGRQRTVNIGPNSMVTYSNGFVVFPGNNISTTSFTYYNGFETRRFGPGDEVTLPGPGQVIVNMETGEVLYTDDSSTISRIDRTVTSFQINLRPPVLVIPDTSIVTSKFTDVDAFFGQTVNVYEGANVRLRCRVTQSVPNPTFSFTRFNGTAGTAVDGTEPRLSITMVSPSESVLTIFEIMPEDQVRYGCAANNSRGRARAFTDIRVRPPVAPVIENRFFPLVPERPGRTITATTANPPRQVTVLVRDRSPLGIPVNDALLTNIINVACKADGLPRPNIDWNNTMTTAGTPFPNDSTVITLRPGRSVYSVNVTGASSTVLYDCVATNAARDANAQVRVITESYRCEGRTASGPCSATCGFGVQDFIPSACTRRRNDVAQSVPASELPVGLYETQFTICDSGTPCPVITFFYNSTVGPCSKTCNRGFRNITNICWRVVDGVADSIVDAQNCRDFGLPDPPTVEECGLDQCPRWVVNSEYSECSSTCRGGTQSRNVTCNQRINVMNMTTGLPVFMEGMRGVFVREDTIVPDGSCRQPMPRRMRDCNIQIPCPVRWFPEEWGPCGADFCQTRRLNCTLYDPSDPDERWYVDTALCLDPPPHTVRSCGGGTCSRGTWTVTARTPCSVTCGFGTRTVTSECRDNGMTVENGFCNFNMRPAGQDVCIINNCPGRCDFEPDFCRIFAILRICKNSPDTVRDCCKSCPLQARPIVLPPELALSDTMLSAEARSFFEGPPSEVEVCCVASSISGISGAMIRSPIDCELSVEINSVETERTLRIIPDTKDNTACSRFSEGNPMLNDFIECTVTQLDGMTMDSSNKTITPTTPPPATIP